MVESAILSFKPNSNFDQKQLFNDLRWQNFCYLSIFDVYSMKLHIENNGANHTFHMISKQIFQCGIFSKNFGICCLLYGQNQIKCAATYKHKQHIYEAVRFMMMMMKKAHSKKTHSRPNCWYLIFDNDNVVRRQCFHW